MASSRIQSGDFPQIVQDVFLGLIRSLDSYICYHSNCIFILSTCIGISSSLENNTLVHYSSIHTIMEKAWFSTSLAISTIKYNYTLYNGALFHLALCLDLKGKSNNTSDLRFTIIKYPCILLFVIPCDWLRFHM